MLLWTTTFPHVTIKWVKTERRGNGSVERGARARKGMHIITTRDINEAAPGGGAQVEMPTADHTGSVAITKKDREIREAGAETGTTEVMVTVTKGEEGAGVDHN